MNDVELKSNNDLGEKCKVTITVYLKQKKYRY